MKTSITLSLRPAALAIVLALLSTAASTGLARDQFVYDPAPVAPGKDKGKAGRSSTSGSHAVLALGEAREVFNSASAPDMAFYIPETSPTIVQVVVEKKFMKKAVYFVKGIRPGTVTGGIVPRACLDKAGFRPNNIADEARVQAALKASPITITVR